MKLYYATQSCSMACYIALEEAALKYTPIEVSWKRNVNVAELAQVNPLGAVPAIVSDEGKVLTQNVAILEYIADLNPKSQLLAEQGSWERRETLSWVSFVAADFHKSFSPFFRLKDISASESAQQDVKKFAAKNVQTYLSHIDKNLAGKDYIMGKNFTIADTYLFVVLGWCQFAEIKLDEYKNVSTYVKRVADRPSVKKALAENSK